MRQQRIINAQGQPELVPVPNPWAKVSKPKERPNYQHDVAPFVIEGNYHGKRIGSYRLTLNDQVLRGHFETLDQAKAYAERRAEVYTKARAAMSVLTPIEQRHIADHVLTMWGPQTSRTARTERLEAHVVTCEGCGSSLPVERAPLGLCVECNTGYKLPKLGA